MMYGNIKYRLYAFVALVIGIFGLSSCSDDDLMDGDQRSDIIRFKVEDYSVQSNPRPKSDSKTQQAILLTSDESDDSLYIYTLEADYPQALSHQGRGSLEDALGDFALTCARESDGSFLSYYFKDEIYNQSGVNVSGRDFYWLNTGNQDFRFYGIAPAARLGSLFDFSYPTPSELPVVEYTVPTDPESQIDLKGVTTDPYPDTYKNVVPLKFKHLCTGIVFQGASNIFPGIVHRITIEGVYKTGTYDMTTEMWSDQRNMAAFSVDPHKSVKSSTVVITPEGEASFFMLPQTVPDGAKIKVEYENGISHANYTLTADISGMEWPAGRVLKFIISTSGITAEQVGLHIHGKADAAVLPATVTLTAVGDSENLLGTPTTISSPQFDLMAPDFIDKMIDNGLTGTNYYQLKLVNTSDPANAQELLLEYTFDYMAFTVDVDNASVAVPVPFYPEGEGGGVTPGETPSTLMFRWAPGDYTDELTKVTPVNRFKVYSSTGKRQIRIYSDLKGETAVPEYRYVAGVNFAKQTVSVDTKLLSAPNQHLDLLFLGCNKLTSVPASLLTEFGGVTSVVGMFQDCTLLPSVPAGLFDPLVNAKDFGRIFQQCRNLKTIPAGLFDKCVEATGMHAMFNGCWVLTSIPEGLFDHNTKNTTFANTFQNCRAITSIPDGLFDHCPDVREFSYTFQSCYELKSIPAQLFYKTNKVTSFANAFQGDRSLTSLPEGLFSRCPDVNTFSYVFHTCKNLQYVPADLFDNCTKVRGYDLAFCGCSSLQTVSGNLFHASHASVVDFSGVFKSSGLTEVPSGIFANMSNAEKFQEAFAECKSLLTFPDDLFTDCKKANTFIRTFSECNALNRAIPAGFFQNCDKTKTTDFEATFYKCHNLKGPIPSDLFQGFTELTSLQNCFYEDRSLGGEIPAGLFATNTKLQNIYNLFAFCNSLTGGIPEGLFDNCVSLTNAGRAFINCNLLTSIPMDLFANCPNINNFTETFAHCYWIHNNVPTLWLSYPDAQHESCYYKVGMQGSSPSTVPNYDQIPASWKNPDEL